MAITEAFGEFRTGKTQLSHTLCVTAQMPGAGGYQGGKVIFLDTEHTLYPLSSYLSRRNVETKSLVISISTPKRV